MLQYMILTDYYILNDIFKLQVVKALLIWKEKNCVNKLKTLHSNSFRIYVTLYDTYQRFTLQITHSDNKISKDY